jgi:NitT/TauT family transport system permease protein
MTASPYARWILRGLSILACLLFWQVAAGHHLDLGLVTFRNVPTPGEVFAALRELLSSTALVRHIGASVARVAAGYASAALGSGRAAAAPGSAAADPSGGMDPASDTDVSFV